MTIKRAKELTRPFIKNSKEYSPIVSSDWTFSIEDSKVILTSIFSSISLEFLTLSSYSENYIFSPYYLINNNSLVGNYYLTSVGLIKEEEYFIAEDLIEQLNNPIKKKDLIPGHIYLSDKGLKHIYLGVLSATAIINDYNSLNKLLVSTDNLSYNLSTNKLVKSQSIRFILEDADTVVAPAIITDLPYMHFNFAFDYLDYFKIDTGLDCLDNNLDLDNLYSITSVYEISREELDAFILSDNEDKLTLEKRESLIIPESNRLIDLFDLYSSSVGEKRILLEQLLKNEIRNY